MKRGIGFSGALFLILAASGCSPIPGLSEARSGDREGLEKAISENELRGSKLRRLAEESLAYEVRHAKDLEDRKFIASLSSCVAPLSSALSARSKKRDGTGAEAALLLFEAGRYNRKIRPYRESEDDAWRALAARDTKGNTSLRQNYYADPDQRVRRAALSAASEAKDEDDIKALLEVARVDPDPLARTRAIAVLGRIGGTRVGDSLLDRFPEAEEALKLAIINAWGKPALFASGGRKQLRSLATKDRGFPGLHAANLLTRVGDAEDIRLGLERLLHFSEEGTTEERRVALRLLPIRFAESKKALTAASASEDPKVALIANARLAGLANSTQSAKARARLQDIAASDQAEAYQARSALAALGDQSVVPLLSKQVESKRESDRISAGRALVRLGAWKELSPLLTDENPDVRRTISCTAIGTPPRVGSADSARKGG